jgi:hypothetical protein
MQRGTLNLDSVYNVFLGNTNIMMFGGSVFNKSLRIVPSIVDANLQITFDNGEWLLLPEDRIIKKFYKTLDNVRRVKREDFPTLPVCAFLP